MQAVILAGGLGTRLGCITKNIPKPMVLVAGKPFLEYQIVELQRQGFCDILLLVGHFSDQIQSHFVDGQRLHVSIRYSAETTPQGTGGGLKLAASMLQDEFLLIYGDSYLPIDYRAVVARMATNLDVTGVAVLYDNLEPTTVNNNVAMDEYGYITKYSKDSHADADLQYVEAGVLVFRKTLLELLPTGRPVSLEQEVFPLLIARRHLIGYVTHQRFYDIGTPERLQMIEDVFSQR
jgi:NDP-sugar pyrophosphorylase family protein